MIALLYLQGFTAGYTIKETNILLSSDKKIDWAEPPNPNSSHTMYIGFEYETPSLRKYFLSFILYCKNFGRLKISDGFIFGH